jgi:signal recognition particle subunit SRP54
MAKGRLDFNDMEKQLNQVLQIGGLKGVMGMLPGAQKIKQQIKDDQLNDRQIGIIRSMTKAERTKPDLINGRRRARIAKGAGVEVVEVNRLLKMHRNMSDMAKAMGKGKMPFGMPGMGGGPSPEALKHLGSGRSLPGLTAPKGLPGLPGALPGLPGGDKKS